MFEKYSERKINTEVIGDQRHDQKEFVWTLHKSRDDWESKIKWPNNNNDDNNNIWQL